MRSVLTADPKTREEAFKEHKENGEQMVHRLRDWEKGDILWGYESVSGSGSTGKTFSRRNRENREERIGDLDGLDPQDAHESARQAFESMTDPDKTSLGGGPDTSVFLYAARIESVRTEGPGPDPGEPPLKFARLGKVVVVDSAYIPPEADDE